MLLSLNWLREFVPYEGPVDTLADRLTMLGLEVEGISRPFAACADVVVGHILTRDQHPDADKLSLCTVDVGDAAPLQIVCGAANVAAGQYVPVAKISTVLPGGLSIKKSKIRGVESFGMICSETELGLAEKSEGILVLEGTPAPGKDRGQRPGPGRRGAGDRHHPQPGRLPFHPGSGPGSGHGLRPAPDPSQGAHQGGRTGRLLLWSPFASPSRICAPCTGRASSAAWR